MLFMIEWLQSFTGVKSKGPNMERIELENLRKEMIKYKQMFQKEDEEAKVKSDTESSVSEDEEQDKFEEQLAARRKQVANKGQRQSVSAEAYGKFNAKKEYKKIVIPKSDEVKRRILEKINKSILFKALDDNDINTVVDAFTEKRFK